MASAFFWQNCVSLLPALFSKGTRWQSRKTRSSSPGKTRKLQLTAEQLSTGECWIPPKKDSPHPRAKEKLQQDGRRSKITFRIKPIPTRDIQRAQTKPSMQQENPQRLSQTWLWVFACLLWKYGSAVAASLFHIWTILINDAVKFWPGKFPGMLTRMLEWVVFPLSRGSSQPRGRTQISHLQTDSLPAEPQGEPKNTRVDSLSLLKQIFLTQELNWALNLVTKLVSV